MVAISIIMPYIAALLIFTFAVRRYMLFASKRRLYVCVDNLRSIMVAFVPKFVFNSSICVVKVLFNEVKNIEERRKKTMKLKTSNGIYDIVNAEHKEGKLNIEFSDKTCEELQEIFSEKDNLARLELSDENGVLSVITGYAVLEQIILQGNTKTVVLNKEEDDTEKRITALSGRLLETAETTEQTAQIGEKNAESIEKIKADMDYIAMNMEVTLDE